MAVSPATITINDATPNPNNNLFTINFNSTHTIHTTLTSDPSIVTSWITSHSPTPSTQVIFGLDVEWRPNFGRQFDNPVATIQLCTLSPTPTQTPHSHSCLIFQILHSPSIPLSLSQFLANEAITFVGVGIHSDIEQLLVDYNLNVKNAVDLGKLAVAKIAGVRKGMGLKELSKVVMGVDVMKPKSVTLSRWDSEWLSYAQIQYACVDAYLSFQIANSLLPLPSIAVSSN